MENYQTAGRLVIRRPCPVVSWILDLSVLCVQGRRNGQRLNFFHFLEALEDYK